MSVWAAGVWCVVSFGFVSFSLGEVLEAWGGVLDERCETQRNASQKGVYEVFAPGGLHSCVAVLCGLFSWTASVVQAR